MSQGKLINSLKILWFVGNLSLMFFFGDEEGFVIAMLLSFPIGLGMGCLAFYLSALLHLHFWNYALYVWPCVIVTGYWQWFILSKWIYQKVKRSNP